MLRQLAWGCRRRKRCTNNGKILGQGQRGHLSKSGVQASGGAGRRKGKVGENRRLLTGGEGSQQLQSSRQRRRYGQGAGVGWGLKKSGNSWKMCPEE